MAIEYYRMQQLVGTAADWSANDVVLANGEIAFQNDSGVLRGKIGNGSDAFSALPFVIEGANIPLAGTTDPVTGLIEFDDGIYFRNFTLGQDPADGNLTFLATGSDAANSSMVVSINTAVWSFDPTGHLVAPNVVYEPTDNAALTTKDYVDGVVAGGLSSSYIPLAGTTDPITGFIEWDDTTLDKQYNLGILNGAGVDNLILSSINANAISCSFVVNMNNYFYTFANTGRLLIPDITYGVDDDLAAANKKYVDAQAVTRLDALRAELISLGVAVNPTS